ncbi:unnamed protein product [Gongylonema pulchrum]|uniref:Reverse transcriptase n=1 Tax=Gongylonema pulchrum TaxID=637853 RepID=A0A183EJU5_9BILA|nr:unnamed protein product [Gongylonema pulchrum]
MNDQGIIYFIPHHEVVMPQKITIKLRTAFDASAKSGNDRSLSDVHYRGPIILSELIGIALWFRMLGAATICNIEKTFLRLELKEEDRNGTCVLWACNFTSPISTQNIIIYRFSRVPFEVVSHHFCSWQCCIKANRRLNDKAGIMELVSG